jgi:hypothetical protein
MSEPSDRLLALPTLPTSQPAREMYGFRRTECACSFCRAFCHHVPGTLAVGDLLALCPPDQDVFRWAEDHLRALTDKPEPALVPRRQANGHCHWLVNGLCAVHAQSPFGCAFFDSHMDEAEVERRRLATRLDRQKDARENGPYVRVWRHLVQKGLTAPSGDRDGLGVELNRLRRAPERRQRRSGV